MSTAATRSTQLVPTFAPRPRSRLPDLEAGLRHGYRARAAPPHDAGARPRQLDAEIAAAKARLGLAPDAPVVSCYQAGRDGFWLHRALTARRITSHVVDWPSIHDNRRARRAKSDRLDATALVRLLLRHRAGERDVWSVVPVPSVEEEDRRHLHRELFTLTRERTRPVNRIKGLLALRAAELQACRGSQTRSAWLTLPHGSGAEGRSSPRTIVGIADGFEASTSSRMKRSACRCGARTSAIAGDVAGRRAGDLLKTRQK
jgi:hypothetical protein